MTRRMRSLTCSIAVLSLTFSLFAQQAPERPPAVAGAFYPADKNELTSAVKALFAKAVPSQKLSSVLAVIAPHAGYVYSGRVAASAFMQVDPQATYDNIFILGPSHHVGFEGASVYTAGNFRTPLGAVTVNTGLGKALMAKSPLFVDRPDAHTQEHSIEVMLPFLQMRLAKPFRIVPIVFGADRPETFAKLAEILRPYLTTKNLFVVSSDFSHYPSYAAANEVDKASGEAVVSNSTDRLLTQLAENERKRYPGLVTSMCGYADVLTLLFMTEGNPRVRYHEILYQNSGDVAGGDRSRVVGYHAIAVTQEESPAEDSFRLTLGEKRRLLAIARETVERWVRDRSLPELPDHGLPAALTAPCGAFVTLKMHGQLRGCIGRFDASEPLVKVVQEMGAAAATQDPRFPPVTMRECKDLDIEISVLTPMKKISSIDEIQLGKHGIYIRKGRYAGTFLPQVATETGWTKEEFLGHCAQDKAGLAWDGWKDADVFIYEALVFSEQELNHK